MWPNHRISISVEIIACTGMCRKWLFVYVLTVLQERRSSNISIAVVARIFDLPDKGVRIIEADGVGDVTVPTSAAAFLVVHVHTLRNGCVHL